MSRVSSGEVSEKKKTDQVSLEQSKNLLRTKFYVPAVHCHPSDHIQVTVQNLLLKFNSIWLAYFSRPPYNHGKVILRVTNVL
jgi:hypothetical protein